MMPTINEESDSDSDSDSDEETNKPQRFLGRLKSYNVQKGFGFIPINKRNIKFPHIGKVIIEDDVEIATACTIDRGSIDDTQIGKNTYLDNQVHIAHNVKIGSNCMIAGQVGFAGSSKKVTMFPSVVKQVFLVT